VKKPEKPPPPGKGFPGGMDENAHGDLKVPPPENVGARWLGCGQECGRGT